MSSLPLDKKEKVKRSTTKKKKRIHISCHTSIMLNIMSENSSFPSQNIFLLFLHVTSGTYKTTSLVVKLRIA
jgi:hypothetical protein